MTGLNEPSCAVGSVGRICFVRWSPRPTVGEVRAVVDAVLTARRTVGRPLALFVIIRSDTQLPEAKAMMEMVLKAPLIDHAIETGITVFEGAALSTRLVRGALDAIGAALKTPWDISDDANNALERTCRRVGLDATSVRAEAVARGFLRP